MEISHANRKEHSKHKRITLESIKFYVSKAKFQFPFCPPDLTLPMKDILLKKEIFKSINGDCLDNLDVLLNLTRKQKDQGICSYFK